MSIKKPQNNNPLEALRELGWEVAKNAGEQITGNYEQNEILPGQSLEMAEIVQDRKEEERIQKERLILERKLREEDSILVEKRTNEIRIQIKAIHEEILRIAEVTPNLNREVEIAAFQAPIEPSTYELYFLERLFEFIKSFRKKIEDAHVWLEVANKRARKKNVWGQNLKKYGAKYLLSAEHYLSRSSA